MYHIPSKILYPINGKIIKYSLEDWTKNLYDIYNRVFTNTISIDTCYEDLFILVNQASLVATYLGNIKLAYDICHEAIFSYMKLFELTKDGKYLNGVFQPWINIGRLYLIKGNHYLAQNHFNSINPKLSSYPISKYCIKKTALNNDTLKLIETCFFFEKINAYLLGNKASKLIHFCTKSTLSHKYHPFTLEVKIMALSILQSPLEALKLLELSIEKVGSDFLPVFILRLVDLKLNMKHDLRQVNLLMEDIFYKNIAHVYNFNLQGIIFCLEMCKRLQYIGNKDLLSQMIDKILVRCKELNDETLIIEILNIGRLLSPALSKEYFIFLKKTKYVYLRKRYLKDSVSYPFPLGVKLINKLKHLN